MNAQLAHLLVQVGKNPRLDALVLQYALPVLWQGVDLFFVDRGFGPEHVFPIFDDEKNMGNWIFYAIEKRADAGEKMFVYASNPLLTDAGEETVKMEVERVFREFRKHLMFARKLKRTLAGIPLEVSADAPRDKIVIHPDLVANIERLALRNGLVTEIVSKEPA